MLGIFTSYPRYMPKIDRRIAAERADGITRLRGADFLGSVIWNPFFHLWYMLALPVWRIMDSLLGLMR